MDVTITEKTDAAQRTVLVVSGSIDLDSRVKLRDAGLAALRRDDATGLVLDLAGVSFVDSTGVGAFVELGSEAGDRDLDFVIHNPSTRVSRILEVIGLDDAWTVTHD